MNGRRYLPTATGSAFREIEGPLNGGTEEDAMLGTPVRRASRGITRILMLDPVLFTKSRGTRNPSVKAHPSMSTKSEGDSAANAAQRPPLLRHFKRNHQRRLIAGRFALTCQSLSRTKRLENETRRCTAFSHRDHCDSAFSARQETYLSDEKACLDGPLRCASKGTMENRDRSARGDREKAERCVKNSSHIRRLIEPFIRDQAGYARMDEED
ncbi:hypothetical protein KM043_008159 [Ampulex compressa]|nr:hypothetical protein KM043_008159 [Ampulex compressa]